MTSPYKRRRPSLVKNLWVYRRLVGLAMVLGLLLWFIWANNAPVIVQFPFSLGTLQSTTGLVILLSMLVGSVVTGVAMTLFFTIRQLQIGADKGADDPDHPLPDDRPPAGYAAEASKAPADDPWK